MARDESNSDRGLGTYLKTKDTDGRSFRLQDSSSAEGPCVWLFTDQKVGTYVDGRDEPAALHLSVEQARELRNALTDFLAYALSVERT